MPRLRPYLVLALLWAGYFHPLLLHPGHVLYADYSDFLAEHLPAKLFLNREWRATGELPLWNPYHFCGSPFVHDIQVGVFYPPYAVTYLVPESAVGSALSWVVALHVLAAGVFTYLYARSHDLGETGSLVAAVGFMLSAKWMTHLLLAGHTITVGLAWLPLVLLGLECGLRTGRIRPVIGAGVALALLILGTHPQWTFYAGVFAGLWTLGSADRTRRGILRWLACGLGAVAVAVPLCAVQLLPTWEAAGQSARTGGVEASGSVALALPTFLGLIGPSLTNDPPRSWEIRGVFGPCWLAAALAAPALAGGRAKWQAGVFLGLVFFAVGGAVLVECLPGFNLFRVPGRMLLIAAFPLAILAGTTTDALIRVKWDAPSRGVVRRYLGYVALGGVLPGILMAAYVGYSIPGRPLFVAGLVGWIGIVLAVAVAAWICRPGPIPNSSARVAVWVIVLLAELFGPGISLVEVRSQAAIYPKGEAIAYLVEHARPGTARVLDVSVDDQTILGIGAPLALVYPVETVRGYNPLDVRHYREFVGFVIGHDQPVRGNSPLTQQVLPNVLPRNSGLFELMNVRYVACAPGDPLYKRVQGRTVAFDWNPPWPPPRPPGAEEVLKPQAVDERVTSFPRAWVVPEAAAMPAGQELAALTACDFRKTVLLTTSKSLPLNAAGPVGTAHISEYRPNRVVIDLDGGHDGFLVLSDVWFPGWVCRVDGVEVPVYRANHAFRAVAIPAGARQAVFAFEPRLYRVGWWVSAVSLGLLGFFALVRLVWRVKRKSPPTAVGGLS